MNLSRSIPLLLLGAAAATAFLSGCAFQQSYEVRGRIVGFGDDERTVIVEHENVPGLMPAMTMPFKTPDRDMLDGFALHDAVRFVLVVAADSAWIYDLEHLPDSAVAAHPAGTPDASFPQTALPLLKPGDVLPPLSLVDQDGEPFLLSDFKGRALLLTFTYTRCPLPDFCPLLSRNFQVLQARLPERLGDRFHLLSISFDPAHDTPEVLRAYARRYAADAGYWTFATGTPEQVAAVAERFGVFYSAEAGQFDHNLATALIDPEGRVRRIWRGNEWQPDDLLEEAAAAVDAPRPPP